MDTAEVVHHDTGPSPRRGRRRRMLVALAVASVAAPLTSGSAIALTGPSDTAAAPAAVKAAKPGTFKIHRSGVVRKRSGHECHRGDKGQGSGSSATMPLM